MISIDFFVDNFSGNTSFGEALHCSKCLISARSNCQREGYWWKVSVWEVPRLSHVTNSVTMFWWFTPHLALVGAVVTGRAQSLDWLWSVSRVVVPHQRWRAGSLSQEADTRGTRCRNQLTGHQITIIGGEGGSNLRWGQKLCTCVMCLIRINNLLSQQLLLTQTGSREHNNRVAIFYLLSDRSICHY